MTTKVNYRMIDSHKYYVTDYGAIGDGVTDDTTAVLAAIDAAMAANGTVVFEPNKTYLMSPTLEEQYPTIISLHSPVVVEGNNAVIKSTTISSIEYSIVHISGTDIVINSLRVYGDAETHDFDNWAGEWGHGFHFGGCYNVELNDTRASQCIGDGYYVGHDKDDTDAPSQRVVIRNGWGESNMRQGMAIVCVDDILVDTFTASDTQPHPSYPATQWNGLDIEPNLPTQPLRDIVINNLSCHNNRYDLSIYLINYAGDTSTDPVNITINGLNAHSSVAAMDITHDIGGTVLNSGSIIIDNVFARNHEFNGVRVTDWGERAPQLTMSDIVIENNNTADAGTLDGAAACNVRMIQGNGSPGLQNITIDNLSVPSHTEGTQHTTCYLQNNQNSGGNAAFQDSVSVTFGVIKTPPFLRGSSHMVFPEGMTPINFLDLPDYDTSFNAGPVPWEVFMTADGQQYVLPENSYGVAHKITIATAGTCSISLADTDDNIQPADPYGFNDGVAYATGYGQSITLRRRFSNSAFIENIIGNWSAT